MNDQPPNETLGQKPEHPLAEAQPGFPSAKSRKERKAAEQEQREAEAEAIRKADREKVREKLDKAEVKNEMISLSSLSPATETNGTDGRTPARELSPKALALRLIDDVRPACEALEKANTAAAAIIRKHKYELLILADHYKHLKKGETILGLDSMTDYVEEKLCCGYRNYKYAIDGNANGNRKRQELPPASDNADKVEPQEQESAVPVLKRRNSDGTTTPIPPAEFTAGDALATAKRFLASAVSHLSPQDKDIFYRSLSLHIEDIMNAASANPKHGTFATETEPLISDIYPDDTPKPTPLGPRTVEIIGGICPYRTDLTTPPDFFSLAMEHTPWKTEPGKRGNPALRKTALWGSPYDYLGPRSNQPIGPLSEMPEWLAALKQINDATLGVTTDNVLLNLYPDGKAGINPHSDWGNPIVIGSWSFGEERRVFRIIRDSEKHDLEPAHGSMIVIPGEVNDAWQHLVLKTAKARIQPRINVTFRKFAVQP